jgi:hypothetical protein
VISSGSSVSRTVFLISAFAVCSLALGIASAAPQRGNAFGVTSTLAGKKVLPHAIAWIAKPAIPPSQVKVVEFVIDGKVRWREGRPPYTYGEDGNQLVTSWLAPGTHRFTTNVVARDGSRGTTTTTARVLVPPAPPAALAGVWGRTVTEAEAKAAGDSSPPGKWRITIDRVGWRFDLPGTHGALMDVAYLPPPILEARSGIFTKLDLRGDEGNIWCDHFQAVRYRWAVQGDRLTLTLAGPKRCGGQSSIWSGTWTRP